MSEEDDDDDDDLDEDDEDDDDDGAAPWDNASQGSDGATQSGASARRAAPPQTTTGRRSPARGGVTAQRTTSGGSDIENVTRRVMDRFGAEGFLFTALDVSNQVKQSLPGVRHREVAPIVRDLFEDGTMGDSYVQTLIDVSLPDGSKTQAFLYHLDDDDPEDYAGTQRQQRAIAPVPVHVLVQGGVLPTEIQIEIGKDARARVPRDFLERNGVTSGTVHVEPGGPQSVLLCEPSKSTGPVALGYSHPTLLYVPISLLTGLDLSKPVMAKGDPRGVVLVNP